jgi:hypothetical protein
MKSPAMHLTHLFALPALAFLACTVDTPTSAGGSTETINGRTAMLYNPDGSPAAGATVRFVPVHHRPGKGLFRAAAGAICTTTTDADGRYSFASVPGDVYNIFGELDGNLSFQDSVPVAAGHAEVEPDTLRDPGTLHGYIDLSDGLDYKTVYALVFGSFTYSTVDSTGAFTLSGLAEGSYAMRFLTTMDDWEPVDTVLPVFAGVDSVMPDTIRLPFGGIPMPMGLSLEYDTLMQVVRLGWAPCDQALVTGYQVYRQHADSSLTRLNGTTLTTNHYADSTVEPDETYVYRVKALDANGNEGPLSAGSGVSTSSLYKLVDSVVISEASEEITGLTVSGTGHLYAVSPSLPDVYRIQLDTPRAVVKLRLPDSLVASPRDIEAMQDGSLIVACGTKFVRLTEEGVVQSVWGDGAYRTSKPSGDTILCAQQEQGGSAQSVRATQVSSQEQFDVVSTAPYRVSALDFGSDFVLFCSPYGFYLDRTRVMTIIRGYSDIKTIADLPYQNVDIATVSDTVFVSSATGQASMVLVDNGGQKARFDIARFSKSIAASSTQDLYLGNWNGKVYHYTRN